MIAQPGRLQVPEGLNEGSPCPSKMRAHLATCLALGFGGTLTTAPGGLLVNPFGLAHHGYQTPEKKNRKGTKTAKEQANLRSLLPNFGFRPERGASAGIKSSEWPYRWRIDLTVETFTSWPRLRAAYRVISWFEGRGRTTSRARTSSRSLLWASLVARCLGMQEFL